MLVLTALSPSWRQIALDPVAEGLLVESQVALQLLQKRRVGDHVVFALGVRSHAYRLSLQTSKVQLQPLGPDQASIIGRCSIPASWEITDVVGDAFLAFFGLFAVTCVEELRDD